MKKILITLVIAFVALMGTASANYGADFVDDSGVNLPGTITQLIGTPTDYNIGLEDFTGHTVYYEAVPFQAGLNMQILKQGTVVTNDTFTDYDVVRITIDQGAQQGDQFTGRIEVYIEDPNAQPNAQPIKTINFYASTSQDFNAQIPEFPTVALPVAAILGLAFFMQRRKEE